MWMRSHFIFGHFSTIWMIYDDSTTCDDDGSISSHGCYYDYVTVTHNYDYDFALHVRRLVLVDLDLDRNSGCYDVDDEWMRLEVMEIDMVYLPYLLDFDSLVRYYYYLYLLDQLDQLLYVVEMPQHLVHTFF